MSAVVNLAERRAVRETEVWRCKCGTVSFTLLDTGQAQCCGCDTVQDYRGGDWIVPVNKHVARVVEFSPRLLKDRTPQD